MTKSEFLTKVPDIIYHPAHGYAELEITDTKDEKVAQYRHISKLTSGGQLGKNWDELFENIRPFLVNGGYIRKEA